MRSDGVRSCLCVCAQVKASSHSCLTYPVCHLHDVGYQLVWCTPCAVWCDVSLSQGASRLGNADSHSSRHGKAVFRANRVKRDKYRPDSHAVLVLLCLSLLLCLLSSLCGHSGSFMFDVGLVWPCAAQAC